MALVGAGGAAARAMVFTGRRLKAAGSGIDACGRERIVGPGAFLRARRLSGLRRRVVRRAQARPQMPNRGDVRAAFPLRPQAVTKGTDSGRMESFLITVVYGSLALLGTAIGVALLEHWRHTQKGRQAPPPPVAQRAAHVDVDLSGLDDLADGSDWVQRQVTVSAAMARMAQPGAVAAVQEPQPSWIETRPMVGMSPETEPR